MYQTGEGGQNKAYTSHTRVSHAHEEECDRSIKFRFGMDLSILRCVSIAMHNSNHSRNIFLEGRLIKLTGLVYMSAIVLRTFVQCERRYGAVVSEQIVTDCRLALCVYQLLNPLMSTPS